MYWPLMKRHWRTPDIMWTIIKTLILQIVRFILGNKQRNENLKKRTKKSREYRRRHGEPGLGR